MRIELRDSSRTRIGRAIINDDARPTRVSTTDTHREVFLNWDSAVDDAGRLRRCLMCGCTDLFQEKAFPQVTGIVVILAFAGAIAGVLGFATNIPVLTAMIGVLVLDVAILLFSRRRLVCYRCRSSYHDLEIARYHRSWDRPTADRYPPSAQPATGSPSPPEAPETASSSAADEATAPSTATRSVRSPASSNKARMRREGFTL